MKKIIFVQLKGKTLGGIWYVHKRIAEELINNDYHVDIIGIRDSTDLSMPTCDKRINFFTINTSDPWEITHRKDILNVLLKGKVIKAIKLFLLRNKEVKKLNIDFNTLKDYITNNKPDHIVLSHYQLINGIPDDYLKKVIYIQHSTVKTLLDMKDNYRVLKNYRHKIGKFLWLCESTYDKAKSLGFTNSTYIYNPVRFIEPKQASVTNNHKLVTISRIASEKRIPLMVEMVNNIFQDSRFSDWSLEIYGHGDLPSTTLEIINENPQIKLMGIIDNARDALMTSSIYLSTSNLEGFPLSYIEAYECGVPVVAFDYGESIPEAVINNKTGLVIYNDNMKEYEEKLKMLMLDQERLKEYSNNAKEYAKKFHINIIIKEWYKLLDTLRKG